MNITREELRRRVERGGTAPGLAPLPAFGLVLGPDEEGPVCRKCGGKGAPIVDGEHLNIRWCDEEARSKGRAPKRGQGPCYICGGPCRSVLDGEAWCGNCEVYQ